MSADDGYFAARSWSGTVKRLRQADTVHVAPCGALGMCYAPPLDSTARLLSAEETRPVAAELARKYPIRRRSPTGWLPRTWRPKMVHYELVGHDALDDQAPAPNQRGDRSGSYVAPGNQGSGPCQVARTHVTDHGAASIGCIWPSLPTPG